MENQPSKESITNNSGASLDGVSKAEARSKRKEAKKQNKGAKKEVSKINEASPSAPIIKSIGKKLEAAPLNQAPPSFQKASPASPTNKAPASINNINTEKLKNDLNKPLANETGVTKAELKAQRRKLQEAQRAKFPTEATTAENTQNKPPSDAESNANLKAKRRAIQEAQRLAKAQAQISLQAETVTPKPNIQKRITPRPRRDSINVVSGANFHKQVQLFNHLYLHRSASLTKELSSNIGLHASIIRLGTQYMSHQILGSNARCLALLASITHLVIDYKTPQQQEFCRSLEANLQASTNYLQKCRPMAVSMTNAVRNIKWQLTQLHENLPDKEKKSKLLDGIDTYINDEIGMADQAISITVQAKICKGDVILTYGCSSIVTKILLDAHKNGKVFNVIVVDARPLLEGRELLRKLVNAGINCSYVLINAASFIMGKVTKVLLGAHSLLANGYVMSRAGTAHVALIAQSFNKPVLVCCETYKFCERVQTDSIVHNEIGDPDKLVNILEGRSPLSNWKECKNVTPLNLMYDVTPPDLVTAVVTELAILPCTSVPVILRIKPTELAL